MNNTKVVLITGAAKRIGAEIARYLHARGMNIIIHYNKSAKEASTLSEELNQLRTNSSAIIQADLAEVEKFPQMIEQALLPWGKIDVLINNASSFFATPLGSISLENWENLMASNLKGPLFLTQYVAGVLQKSQGSIINISDIHGQKPLKNYSVYSIAKAGLIMLTKALALELGPEIRVNSVAPGAALWPIEENELPLSKQEEIIQKTSLKRPGSPLDIAKAAHFLIAEAPYITGQVINVDGGRILSL